MEEMWLNVAGVVAGVIIYVVIAKLGNVLVKKNRE